MAVIPSGWGVCALQFTGVGVPNGAAVVFGFQNVGEWSAFNSGSQILNAINPLHNSISTSDVSLVGADIKLGPNDTGPMANVTQSGNPGDQGADSVSPQVGYLIKKNTGFGGRRSRGRMTWPGASATVVSDSGDVDGTFITATNGALSTAVAALSTNGVPMSILHTPSYTWELVGGQPRRVYATAGSVPVPYLVTGMAIDARVATQRRRMR